MKKIKMFIIAVSAVAALCSSIVNASVIKYDVDTALDTNTLDGWTSVFLGGANGVTFESVGGAELQFRDRGNGNTNGTNGDTANNDMWRDFIFAYNSSSNISGMNVLISGLFANQKYSIVLWAFDDSSNNSRNMTWNGNALNIPSSPDPTSLSDQSVTFTAMANSDGILTLMGRVGSPIGECCNVFVNGFEITAVPEPSTLAILALSMIGLGARRFKK